MNRGYIKLWRSSADSDLYFSEPFTKWQAWSDLLITANHKTRIVNVRGIMVTVEAGSVLASGDFLASRWKWSRGKVNRFLAYLESKTVQQIVQHKSNVCNVITIVEWELYQANGTASSTADGQQTVQQTDTPKNVKNDKKGKKEHLVADAPVVKSGNSKATLLGSLDDSTTEARRAALSDWLDYKSEIRNTYKPKGFASLVKVWSKYNDAELRNAVDESMANGWKGLFKPKDSPNAPVATRVYPKSVVPDFV